MRKCLIVCQPKLVDASRFHHQIARCSCGQALQSCSRGRIASLLLVLCLERYRLELLYRVTFDTEHVVDPVQNDGEGGWFTHMFGAFDKPARLS